jgi:hypothetical protein
VIDTVLRYVRVHASPARVSVAAASAFLMAMACNENAPVAITQRSANTMRGAPCAPPCVLPVPAFYGAFGSNVTVSRVGTEIVLKSDGIPDHKSPYFRLRDPRYEAYNGSNPDFKLNPNHIGTQTLTFRIPMNPTRLVHPSPTPLGPIGIALNGVPLYNQYAAGWDSLTTEMDSFDQYNGHPENHDWYHYHVEPVWLTRASKEALIGVLLDGFPVYGPMEGGRLVSTKSLDAAHGHVGNTPEFPFGIYHYHTTATFPYINGSGFAGTPGTVTQ